MTTLSTLTDDELAAEMRRLTQKRIDLERDLFAIMAKLEEGRIISHRRFCERVRPIAEGKKHVAD